MKLLLALLLALVAYCFPPLASAQSFVDTTVPGDFAVIPPYGNINYDVTGSVVLPATYSVTIRGEAVVYNAPRSGYGLHLDDPTSVTMTGNGITVTFTATIEHPAAPFQTYSYHVWTAEAVPAGTYTLEVVGKDEACKYTCGTFYQQPFSIDTQ